MELNVDRINVSGRIDELLNHIPSELRKNELLERMINRPIMDGDKVIGAITSYDLEAGFWNGFIWCNAYPSIIEDCICSVELSK